MCGRLEVQNWLTGSPIPIIGKAYIYTYRTAWIERWGPMAFKRLGIIVLLAALAGCASEPIGKKDLLDFLHDGVTTREEVILHLAEPSATFEGGRIVTYRLDQDDGGYTILGSKGRGWSGRFSLVLSFDEHGVLRKHSLVRVKEILR